MLWSFVYVVLCRLLQLIVLLCRSERSKEFEILVLIFGRGELEHVLRVYARHYNRHRPHRALALHPPGRVDGIPPAPLQAPPDQLIRRDLLGGLIHEYEHAA